MEEDLKKQSARKGSKTLSIPLCVIALVAAGAALMAMKGILMPLVVAFFFATLLGPIVDVLVKRRIPTALAVLIIILVTALVVFLLGQLFYGQAKVFIAEYPEYHKLVAKSVEEFKESDLLAILPAGFRDLLDVKWEEVLPVKTVVQHALGTLGTLLSMLGTLLLILVYMIFILPERNSIPFRLRAAYDKAEGARIWGIVESIQRDVESFIVGKTVISLATGILVTLFLWIMGVKFFFIWGIITFLFNFIPNIGSTLATLFPILMAIIQPAPRDAGMALVPEFGLGQIIVMAVVLVAIQFAVGSLIEPRLLGNRLRLSPLVVFLSFIFWGWLWGVPGMILSTPIMATVRIVFENVEPLKPIAVLVSNQGPRSDKTESAKPAAKQNDGSSEKSD